jgi:hypothetical protein
VISKGACEARSVARTVAGEKAMPRRRGALSESDPGLVGRRETVSTRVLAHNLEIDPGGATGQLSARSVARTVAGASSSSKGENRGCEDLEENEARKPALGSAGGEHVGPRIPLDDPEAGRRSREAVGLSERALSLGEEGPAWGWCGRALQSPAFFLQETEGGRRIRQP